MPRRNSGSGGSKAGLYAAILFGLAACFAALMSGDYEINTMAPVIGAPREKVFRYLSDPRNFANLAPLELHVTIDSEGASRVSGNCTREARVFFTISLLFVSIPWSAQFSATFVCPDSGSAANTWVEYRSQLFPFASHRTTYFIEELVSTDGKLQTEVHERTLVRTVWLWQLISAPAHKHLHARLLGTLKDVLECSRS